MDSLPDDCLGRVCQMLVGSLVDQPTRELQFYLVRGTSKRFLSVAGRACFEPWYIGSLPQKSPLIDDHGFEQRHSKPTRENPAAVNGFCRAIVDLRGSLPGLHLLIEWLCRGAVRLVRGACFDVILSAQAAIRVSRAEFDRATLRAMVLGSVADACGSERLQDLDIKDLLNAGSVDALRNVVGPFAALGSAEIATFIGVQLADLCPFDAPQYAQQWVASVEYLITLVTPPTSTVHVLLRFFIDVMGQWTQPTSSLHVPSLLGPKEPLRDAVRLQFAHLIGRQHRQELYDSHATAVLEGSGWQDSRWPSPMAMVQLGALRASGDVCPAWVRWQVPLLQHFWVEEFGRTVANNTPNKARQLLAHLPRHWAPLPTMECSLPYEVYAVLKNHRKVALCDMARFLLYQGRVAAWVVDFYNSGQLAKRELERAVQYYGVGAEDMDDWRPIAECGLSLAQPPSYPGTQTWQFLEQVGKFPARGSDHWSALAYGPALEGHWDRVAVCVDNMLPSEYRDQLDQLLRYRDESSGHMPAFHPQHLVWQRPFRTV